MRPAMVTASRGLAQKTDLLYSLLRPLLSSRLYAIIFVTIQVLFTKLEISNLRNFRNLRNYKMLAPALSISEIS
jgi:hypothetical protein